MEHIGDCSQCGGEGMYQMHTPSDLHIRYITSPAPNVSTGWVTVCKECELILGDVNLKNSGYKWDMGMRRWVAPPIPR